jgi:hypothetical protein
MTDLRTPKAPCAIRELVEAFAVIDADGRAVSYVYFAEGARRSSTGRWSREEARAIAERIARGFTRAAERDQT